MIISELDLETRSRLYTLTKKVLRKYQKGIISGKLTSEKFVENMLCDDSIIDLLNSNIVVQNDFKLSYRDYVDKLIKIQNETLRNCKKGKKNNIYKKKADVSMVIELKQVLKSTGYKLSIPAQYLTNSDIESIIKFVITGEIELGNEKIYNYVHK